ncbi:MAG: hypothetical protein H6600_00445 [Flavobacteriales bacterium]|nr:hypothetical protein [Flavobacteriales bacterium]
MRKLVMTLVFGLMSMLSLAQSTQLNMYLGPGYGRYGRGGMFNLDLEIPMLDDNLTIGPSVGIGLGNYVYNVNGTHYREQYMVINPAVVGHYYFDWLIPDMPSHFDLFAKAKLGMRWFTGNDYTYRGYYLDWTLQAGGRYHFNEKASFYLAVGYAYAPLNLGLTIQL